MSGTHNHAATATALIELHQLRKSYNLGQPNEAEILHGIDLHIAHGEFLALIGPSGSGKSTLLNILGLLEPLTDGSYQLQGQAVQGLDDEALTLLRRRALGFVFQFHHLLPAFTALENVTLPALMSEGRVSTKQREQARALLETVGLAGAAHKPPSGRSGGIGPGRGGGPAAGGGGRPLPAAPRCRRWCWPTSRPATSTPPRPTPPLR